MNALSDLTIPTSLGDRHYYPRVTDKETEACGQRYKMSRKHRAYQLTCTIASNPHSNPLRYKRESVLLMRNLRITQLSNIRIRIDLTPGENKVCGRNHISNKRIDRESRVPAFHSTLLHISRILFFFSVSLPH